MSYEIQQLKPENYQKLTNIWDMNASEYKINLAKKCYDELVSGNRVIFVYIENDDYLGQKVSSFSSFNRKSHPV